MDNYPTFYAFLDWLVAVCGAALRWNRLLGSLLSAVVFLAIFMAMAAVAVVGLIVLSAAWTYGGPLGLLAAVVAAVTLVIYILT